MRWKPWCQREGSTSKHPKELTVLIGDPQGPVKGPLSFVFINRGYSGTKRGRVHSCKGSCTPAWHFSYLHCLIVSVDVFMIFSPSLFVCGSFFSTNALLHLPPSLLSPSSVHDILHALLLSLKSFSVRLSVLFVLS